MNAAAVSARRGIRAIDLDGRIAAVSDSTSAPVVDHQIARTPSFKAARGTHCLWGSRNRATGAVRIDADGVYLYRPEDLATQVSERVLRSGRIPSCAKFAHADVRLRLTAEDAVA